MCQRVTPYETGERLQPFAWVQSCPAGALGGPRPTADDYGRVDFVDHEERAVMTLYVSREPGGYVLHVEDLVDEALSVTGGTEAIVIALEHCAGVDELLKLAERGREDFLHQASYGDYTDQDQADAATRWAAARQAAHAIRNRLR